MEGRPAFVKLVLQERVILRELNNVSGRHKVGLLALWDVIRTEVVNLDELLPRQAVEQDILALFGHVITLANLQQIGPHFLD